MNAPVNGTLGQANDTVTLQLTQASSSASIQVTGTFSMTATVQISNDGINFYTWKATDGSTSTFTSAGILQFSTGGFLFLRTKCTSYVSGSANVLIMDSTGAV